MNTTSITGKIQKVSGPLVIANHMKGANIQDVVRVGDANLIGEIIELHNDTASIQVYEETSGLKPNEEVASTGKPLSLMLGPGMLGAIYDGIQRPLDVIKAQHGAFIARGAEAPALDEEKKWDFTPTMQEGAAVSGGDIIGSVQEGAITHKVMVPPKVSGTLTSLTRGSFTVRDTIGEVTSEDGSMHALALAHPWPIRTTRPVAKKLVPTVPLVTGQRVIDTFFPI